LRILHIAFSYCLFSCTNVHLSFLHVSLCLVVHLHCLGERQLIYHHLLKYILAIFNFLAIINKIYIDTYFYVDISLHLFWVNDEKHDFWIIGYEHVCFCKKPPTAFPSNCTALPSHQQYHLSTFLDHCRHYLVPPHQHSCIHLDFCLDSALLHNTFILIKITLAADINNTTKFQ
jgi:hypothetical protein